MSSRFMPSNTDQPDTMGFSRILEPSNENKAQVEHSAPVLPLALNPNYPAACDIITALTTHNLSRLSLVDYLRDGTIDEGSLGSLVWGGGYSVVVRFRSKRDHKVWALRCPYVIISNQASHYDLIRAHLAQTKLPYFIDFKYHPQGLIWASSQCLPILQMKWVLGFPLKNFIEKNLGRAQIIRDLAQRWRIMLSDLHNHQIAHGDLHHGNVLITEHCDYGSIKLIDYDTFVVPELQGKVETNAGLPAYQHPARRSLRTKHLAIDAFSGIAIYLSLRALAERPQLWVELDIIHRESLIFEPEDYLMPNNSKAFHALSALSPEISALSRALQTICSMEDAACLPTLEDILTEKWISQPTGSISPEVSASKRAPSIGWLHLSDLHQGISRQKWLWPNVRERFFQDLARLHKKSGPWDVVFFTGDLTQTGSEQEFAHLDETLGKLWMHLRHLGSDPILLAVPGNHDLVRPRVKAARVRVLRLWHDDRELRDEFWRNEEEECRKGVTDAFAPYTRWARRSALFAAANPHWGLLPGDFSATIVKSGLRLGVVGLNSAFLQLTGDPMNGRLDLDVSQVHEACRRDAPDWVSEHDVTVLLTHHPASWLHPAALGRFRAEINPPGRFAAHLFGHMHEPHAEMRSIGGAAPQLSIQGTSLFGLECYGDENGSGVERRHGYSAGRIELRSDRQLCFRVFPRFYNKKLAGHSEIDRDQQFTLDEEGAFSVIFVHR